MKRLPGPIKLAKFLEKHGIPKAKAAKALGVSHVAVVHWVTRASVPTVDRRKAIAVWTNGEVPESDWLSDRERAAAEKLAEVKPFVPPSETPAA